MMVDGSEACASRGGETNGFALGIKTHSIH